jgi:predicted DCC family thiol-disulfide oxidoreductase YuxK
MIFYDGHCGLCQRFVRFAVQRDHVAWFAFAPLGGETFRAAHGQAQAHLANTVVVQTAAGQTLVRSAAVLHVLRRLGGAWSALATLLGVLPTRLLDTGYRAVARLRRKLWPAPAAECPVVPAGLRSRFLP